MMGKSPYSFIVVAPMSHLRFFNLSLVLWLTLFSLTVQAAQAVPAVRPRHDQLRVPR